jgi:hypothetical protein
MSSLNDYSVTELLAEVASRFAEYEAQDAAAEQDSERQRERIERGRSIADNFWALNAFDGVSSRTFVNGLTGRGRTALIAHLANKPACHLTHSERKLQHAVADYNAASQRPVKRVVGRRIANVDHEPPYGG